MSFVRVMPASEPWVPKNAQPSALLVECKAGRISRDSGEAPETSGLA